MTETYDKINHWYGWNNEADHPDMCPVHPKTIVEVVTKGSGPAGECEAKEWGWSSDIIAFRITRLYVEPKVPREWWINVYEQPGMMTGLYSSEVAANMNSSRHLHECVLVREVLPEPTQ